MKDVPHQTQGRTIKYGDNTSVPDIGQDITELLKTTSENTSLAEQYLEAHNLFINPTKTQNILFQIKQYRQESELKLLINREIVNKEYQFPLGYN
jgi:anion-transporting  ArsA/GET3 family ATPase